MVPTKGYGLKELGIAVLGVSGRGEKGDSIPSKKKKRTPGISRSCRSL